MLLRSRGVLAAGSTFDEIAKQIGQLAIPVIQDPNRNEDEYLFQAASLVMKIKESSRICQAIGNSHNGALGDVGV
jgi:hypothetical protein